MNEMFVELYNQRAQVIAHIAELEEIANDNTATKLARRASRAELEALYLDVHVMNREIRALLKKQHRRNRFAPKFSK